MCYQDYSTNRLAISTCECMYYAHKISLINEKRRQLFEAYKRNHSKNLINIDIGG